MARLEHMIKMGALYTGDHLETALNRDPFLIYWVIDGYCVMDDQLEEDCVLSFSKALDPDFAVAKLL